MRIRDKSAWTEIKVGVCGMKRISQGTCEISGADAVSIMKLHDDDSRGDGG